MAIYFFDKNQTLIKIVPESATFEAIQTQELDDDSLLKDTLSVTIKGDEKLLNAEYMAVKSYTGNAQTFDMYRIVTDTTPDKSMSFTGMSLAPYELNGHIIQDLRPANHSLSYTLNRVLDGTDWRVGYIDDGLPNVTTTFYYVSAKEALKELQSLVGCEFVFKVEISGQKITDKWIDIYKEMGNRTKKRFNYGTNALTVVRETNKADIYTALIGRGKGEEISSAEENESGQAGYGRKITFEDIEWKKSSGKPLDKPKGQYYLELPQATQAYGIKNIDGTMKARVGIVDFDDEEDKNRLIDLTYQQLLVSSRPKVLFKTTVANIGATGIGDTVTIHRHDLGIHYQTRVRKIVRNKLNDNKTQIELGDAVVTASTKQTKQNNATIKNLNNEIDKIKANVTTSQNSADGKNTIFYGSVTPERQRTGDTWYRPHPSIAGETQMLTWNGTAWELVIDTSDLTSVSRAVEDAAKKADEAVQSAKDADDRANSALEKAGANANLLTTHQNTLNTINNTTLPDINKSLSDAIGDAQSALSSASSAMDEAKKADGKIADYVTKKGLVNGTTVDSKIDTATGAISRKITTVEGKIDDLQVGGRNLISVNDIDVDNARLTNMLGTDKFIYPNAGYAITSKIPVKAGEYLTITNHEQLSGYMALSLFDENNVHVNRPLMTEIDGNPKSYTYKVTDGITYARASYRKQDVGFIKLERGNKATDWTPAPEDNLSQSEFQIFESTYSEDVKGINSSLTDLSTKKLDNTTYTTFYTNEYKKTAQGVTDTYNKVNKIIDANGNSTDAFAKAVYDRNATRQSASFNKVTKDLVKTATYTAGINGINGSITTIQGKLDNLQVGGRNLLRGTADFNTDFWQNASTAIPSTRDPRYKQVGVIGDFGVVPITTMATQGWNFEVGEDYVVSVWAKSEVSGNKIGLTAQSNAVYFEPQVVDVWEWRRFIWKFKATSSNLTSFRFETRNDEKVWITQPQIEKGSVPTDWSPAPEDMLGKADFQIFKGTYESNDQVIKSRLTAIDSGKEGSIAYRLNATESTASGNSQLISTINKNYVKQSNIDASILADKQIKDTRNTNQLPSWYISNYPKQQVREFKTTAVMGIGSGTYGVLITDVQWYDKSGGAIKQQFTANDAIYTRSGNTEATAWGAWTKQVDTSDTTYQKITQTSSLYERVLGSTSEASVKSNISRVVQTSGLIQQQVLGVSGQSLNLIVRKDEYKDKYLVSGNLTYSGTGNAVMKDKIPVVAGEMLTFTKTTSLKDDNWRIEWYDSDGKYMNRLADTNNLILFQVPQGASYLWVSYPNSSNVQLERGEDRTPWKPSLIDIQDGYGGRNLLRNSDFSSGNSPWGVNNSSNVAIDEATGIVKVSKGKLLSGIYQNVISELDVGEIYTISAEVKGTGSILMGFSDNRKSFPLTAGVWSKLSYTTTHEDSISVTFYTNTTDTEFEIRNLQVERGMKATDWTPNPEDTNSKITQLADNINLKVSKSGLLSQINVQAGGVLIQSGKNKLNVTPTTTYIENGTIKSAMIESLEAGKIKTGTLDAGKVKVINIDAENITANKTSFVQSAWNGINNTVSVNASGIRSANSNGDWTLYHSGAVSFGNSSSQGIYLEYADGARNGLAINNRGATNTEITLDLVSSARNTINFGRRTDTNGYDFRIDHYQGTKVSFDGRGVQRYTFNVNSDAQSHAISILGHGATSGYNSGSGLSIGLETADGATKGSRFYFSSNSDLVWLGKDNYSDLKPLAVFDLQFRWGQNERKSLKAVLEYLSRAAGVDINNIPSV